MWWWKKPVDTMGEVADKTAEEICIASNMCKPLEGRFPDIAFRYNFVEYHKNLVRVGVYEIRFNKKFNFADGTPSAEFNIHIGPYESILRCVYEWNEEVEKVEKAKHEN